MSHTIQQDTDNQIIEVTLQGQLTIEEVQVAVVEVSSLVKEINWFRILVDFREAQAPTVSIVDIYELPGLFLTLVKPLGISTDALKRAVVTSPSAAEKAHFFETVMLNNSHRVRMFQDMDEARAWLLEKS